MTALVFAFLAAAMIVVWRGHRLAGISLFVVAGLLALAWFDYRAASDVLHVDY